MPQTKTRTKQTAAARAIVMPPGASLGRMVEAKNIRAAAKGFARAKPFPHCVIDGFFKPEAALALAKEFPPYDSPKWLAYDSPVQVKKTLNSWDAFPPATYRVFAELNSAPFVAAFGALFGRGKKLFPDAGLHGGGWHSHKKGGTLNTHLDYNIHPKAGMQRKLNLLVYLNRNWREEWGGALGLWGADKKTGKAGKLEKEIAPLFNRAVVFDTTCDSWHGMTGAVCAPDGEERRSLAIYYLCAPPKNITAASERPRALFLPAKGQEKDPEVLKYIRDRAKKTNYADGAKVVN